MRRTVFYSWQSDLPNATNRGFIQSALERAADAIAGDDTVAVEPVIDRDTEGVAGSPDIASTIFAKINVADIVVADVSIVSDLSIKRRMPNPNVLIEVGYALKALNFERVILVFNSAFGEIDSLPFDLRMRRLVVYRGEPNEKERAAPRTDLASKLEIALRSAIALLPSPETTPSASPAIEAIENQRPNRRVIVRSELARILKGLEVGQSKKTSDGGTSEEFLAALSKTEQLIVEFSKIAESIAVMGDAEIALETYVWFGEILLRYSLPKDFSGTYNEADFDFFRFVGHELFVSLFAFLMREQKWEIISRLLNEVIPVRYLRRENGPGNAEWSDISRYVVILGGESQRRGRVSFHGDLLNERHSKGVLAGALPFDEFADADFFLYLRGLLPDENFSGEFSWKPWSAVLLQGTPRFVLRAQSKGHADILTRAVAVPSILELKKRLRERGPQISILYRHSFWHYPVRDSDIEKIATRP